MTALDLLIVANWTLCTNLTYIEKQKTTYEQSIYAPFETQTFGFDLAIMVKVCVVGAGVIGLSTALCIVEHIPDVEVTIIADRFSPDTTADGANDFWYPSLIGDTSVDLVK